MPDQYVPINFSRGLETKADPNQIPIGEFGSLVNSVFTTTGRLTKRPGYGALPAPPGSTNYITTLSTNVLTAIGESIYAYSPDRGAWVTQGSIQPCALSVQPVIRNNFNQTQVDMVVAANGLGCVVYVETDGSNTYYKYAIVEADNGLIIGSPTTIPAGGGALVGNLRVFLIGTHFVIGFINNFSGNYHLQYIAISSTTLSTTSATNIDTHIGYNSSYVNWDGATSGTTLYISYSTTSGPAGAWVTSLTESAASSGSAPAAAVRLNNGDDVGAMTICIDNTIASPLVYIVWAVNSTGIFLSVVDLNLNLYAKYVELTTAITNINNFTAAAAGGTCIIYFESANNYSYDSSVPSHYIATLTVTAQAFHSVFSSGASTITASSAAGLVNGMYLLDGTTTGNVAGGGVSPILLSGAATFTVSGTTLTLSSNTTGNSASSPGDRMLGLTVSNVGQLIRSVGLASKAFVVSGTTYLLTVYQSPLQSTYFLINATATSPIVTSTTPVVLAKLAYQNARGYLTLGLPNVTVTGSAAQIPYLIKDFVEAVSTQNTTTQTQTGGIYSQTGINIGTFNLGLPNTTAVEIAKGLQIGGGFGWTYDGYLPVENNFFLYPDSVEVTSAGGGSMTAQQYYYQVIYEWTDNQGNIQRSSPSVPVTITLTSDTSVNVHIPTLRLTYKTATAVKITIYRWSAGQPIYYRVTSVSSPTLNDLTADSITYNDKATDATIAGNEILYTTGGVVPDVNPPATNVMTLFDTRAWVVSAEDPNILWVSKQVIENTPVEWSSDFTIYVAPNIGTVSSTGPITALFPMDDKLIICKENALYYINGVGPDNLGTTAVGSPLGNYSQPTFITAAVGCTNPNSMVLVPDGLMFQSDKGIWLLSRDLSTHYIGEEVEAFNSYTVSSALVIPGTNYILFTLSGTNQFLMYDFFEKQWGTFVGVQAVAATLYQNLHTVIDNNGNVLQVTPNTYLDNGSPVLMSFKTGWLNLAALQGYQRARELYLLGNYQSPHSLMVTADYDYDTTATNTTTVTPSGLTANQREQWRIHTKRQLCEAIQIAVQENYTGTAGQALTMSGLMARVMVKSGARPIPGAQSAGLG